MRRPRAEADDAVHTPHETNSVKHGVSFKARKDISGKERLGDISRLAGKLIVTTFFYFRRESFDAPRLEIVTGALFLQGFGIDDVPGGGTA